MRLAVILVPASLALAAAAHADVVISAAATANMSCSGGVCAPTAKNAVLNVGDLENLLSSGNVEVTTTGSGIQAGDIQIDAPLTWSSTGALALDAYQSVLVERLLSVTGQGGLSITTNDGGSEGYFGFLKKGHVTFSNLSGALTINGSAYALAGDIATLAADIAANSTNNYALARDYDAGKDGTYSTSPIPTEFAGSFEGLGNTISNLSINDSAYEGVGLFARLSSGNDPGGAVENISLRNLQIGGGAGGVGGIAGANLGTISGAFVSGTLTSRVQNGEAYIGGLVGVNYGTITRSGAAAALGSNQVENIIGGLSGADLSANNLTSTITQSYADCTILGGAGGELGGLVGSNGGPITQSYAMGSVAGGSGTYVGGLTGGNGMITQSYSTTALENVGHGNRDAGGLIGVDGTGGNSSDYWDITTSNIEGRNQGAGTPNKDRGIEGLTSEELQATLPKGFDPKVWAEDPKINKGFPYLIANPPRKD
jgi:hypothetical protein